jgi:dTDP-4-amino-4,6-dideoxygalactose transaminase
MKRLRSHGMARDQADFLNRELAFDEGVPNPWYYEMHAPGWNYRMPDILCALGISQLRKLPQYFARRQAIAARYDAALTPLAPVLRPTPRDGAHGLHLYGVLIDFDSLGISRRHVMTELRGKGVGTQVHYVPVHRQPYYRADAPDLTLPGADAYYARCLSLPLFPSMTDADVDKVVAAVTSVIGAA